MKIEHVALNVEDPVAMREWYGRHLGLTLVRCDQEAPYVTFMADDSGNVMIELYKNPSAPIPPYGQMDPLILHLAFVSADPDADKGRLEATGARFVSEARLDDGSVIIMMRDPWGFSIQLCKRGKPMLKFQL